MATMPVLTEVPGQQELYTRDHGVVKVAGLSFIDGGYHIVKCPNGAYMHANGLPVSDEDHLRAAIPNPFLEDALKWFNSRHEMEENPPQPIIFHQQGYPIFADGSIPDFSDLYAYFAPGPILTAAIVALQQYHDRQPGQEVQKLRAVPPQTEVTPAPAEAAPISAPEAPKTEAKVPQKNKAKAKKSSRKSPPSRKTISPPEVETGNVETGNVGING